MNILIADDDVVSRTVLATVLERRGHTVETAVDGAQALEGLLRPGAPMLAILDWMMPGIDGLEVVRRMRASPDLGVAPYLIMLTARVDKAAIVAGLRAGADDYIGKPFHADELCARVDVGRRLTEARLALAAKVAELQAALDHIKTLRGIVPICSGCKKIRDDQGYWSQVEAYITKHSEARFTHGLCPECIPKYFPDLPPES